MNPLNYFPIGMHISIWHPLHPYEDDYPSAILYIDKALALRSQMRPGRVLMNLNFKAVCLFKLGEINKACLIWTDILYKRDPFQCLDNHAICQMLTNLGDGQFILKNYHLAKHIFHRVLTIDPYFKFQATKESLIYLIVSYLKVEEPDQSKKYLKEHKYLMEDEFVDATLKKFDIQEYMTYFK